MGSRTVGPSVKAEETKKQKQEREKEKAKEQSAVLGERALREGLSRLRIGQLVQVPNCQILAL